MLELVMVFGLELGSSGSMLSPAVLSQVKFYTREGNWDLVGNNFPVFFVRDGIKFPDMVHALKPNPKNHIQEGWRIADFFSHIPESMHMVSLQASGSVRLPDLSSIMQT